MKIVSYNLNGIRAAMRKGLHTWIGSEKPDVICIQETKAQPEDVDLTPFEEMGYHPFWHSAEKKGYSGVLTMSLEKPRSTEIGMGVEQYDREGRVIRTDFKDFSALNCYFPSGTSGDARQAVKMQFLEDFYDWARDLKKSIPRLVIPGDYNIANTAKDIHDPVRNKNTSGFKPEEREWMDKWFESGFSDPFRLLNPEKIEYSWWSYRAASRKRNKGWRIDYISVSDELKGSIKDLRHAHEAVHSDHCPVVLELGI
ncbi:MAG: exodeoxyribonuclease III [Saprospirales bacterium]|nr:MAG: exodeoxyribonuclease III [Saprospirales bacterium]